MHFQSTLSKITEQVFSATTAQEAKSVMLDYLQSTRVKDRDLMISTVTKMNNLLKVQTYFTNCLLKFEGMGVGVSKKED